MTGGVGQRLIDDPGHRLHRLGRLSSRGFPGSPNSPNTTRAVADLDYSFDLDRHAGTAGPADRTGESVLQVGPGTTADTANADSTATTAIAVGSQHPSASTRLRVLRHRRHGRR